MGIYDAAQLIFATLHSAEKLKNYVILESFDDVDKPTRLKKPRITLAISSVTLSPTLSGGGQNAQYTFALSVYTSFFDDGTKCWRVFDDVYDVLSGSYHGTLSFGKISVDHSTDTYVLRCLFTIKGGMTSEV